MSNQRLPSLFRTARNQQFHYEPRYYDPVKEDLAEREHRIRKELNLENSKTSISAGSGIRGSFRKSAQRRQGSSGFIRIALILLMGGGAWTYLYIGNQAFYLLLLIPVFYFIFRKFNIL